MKSVKELLLDSPVIAAVKEDAELQKALDSDCQVIFLLCGTVVNIDAMVHQIHRRNKICFVHIDLVDGLSSREAAVDGLVKLCNPDGIISTRAPQIRRAQQLGLLTVQRVFLLDSMSLRNLLAQLGSNCSDFIEVLPGIIPGIIAEISQKTDTPLIAGGLIRSKQDVMQAIQAGVLAVSTSCQNVWEM